MAKVLEKGAEGPEVLELQNILKKRGYPLEPDGIFGTRTYQAVRAFQSQNLDQHGQPLKVDGEVGPLTWWSLTHPKPVIETPSAIRYDQMPPEAAGGSRLGRAGLAAAIDELTAGAGEIGGDNAGPWVRKYLEPAGLEEGNSWCASFVSWCFFRACGHDVNQMPFPYSAGARDLLSKFKKKGWAYEPQSGYEPQAGDVVFWWRVSLSGWQGHVGMIHQLKDGMLYTIEGNRSPKVQGFSYVFSRMEKLLGFGHVTDPFQ
jgi:hypothetical protein